SCSARRLAVDGDELADAVRAVAARATAQWAGELVAERMPAVPGEPAGVGRHEDLVSGPRR
ncbi:MAG TPA: hypothetical protein VNP37_20745, partial [Actinomycetospora sp.]|nr:hypothetical protein [Actinomycetospora sp.]